VAVHLLVSMEDSANLYCNRLRNNKQVLSKVKNNNIVVVMRQSSDFYDSHSLRSVADDILFESKGGLVFSTPMFCVSPESSYSHGDFLFISFKGPIVIVPQTISRYY